MIIRLTATDFPRLPAAEGFRFGSSRIITELGVFELWRQSTKSAQRWKLEFSVRQDAEGEAQ